MRGGASVGGCISLGRVTLVLAWLMTGREWHLWGAKAKLASSLTPLELQYFFAPFSKAVKQKVSFVVFQMAKASAKAYQPINRPIQPEEVAKSIAFLASDDARMITGIIHKIDGGWHLAGAQPKVTLTGMMEERGVEVQFDVNTASLKLEKTETQK